MFGYLYSKTNLIIQVINKNNHLIDISLILIVHFYFFFSSKSFQLSYYYRYDSIINSYLALFIKWYKYHSKAL